MLKGEVSRPGAFLDRDGVINVDHNFVFLPEHLELIPGVVQAVRRLNDLGYAVVVVTNQSGIARGHFTEDEFHAFTEHVREELAKQGARIDATYFCPHHPDAALPQYRRECECRKPGAKMIRDAARDMDIDLGRSFMIGDNPRDVGAAEAAGIPGFQFTEGNLDEFLDGVLRALKTRP